MTAPLHERLAEAANAAGGERWIAAKYGPKTVGVGAPGGPAYMLVRPNHGDMDSLWPLIEHIRAADPQSVAKLCEQVRVMKEALEKIEAIKDQIDGGDWDEIAKACGIAHLAMLVIRGSE